MAGFLVSVEEYANNKGVTKSAVYKQIKRHEEELKGHIENNAGTMWLDEEATRLLDEASNKSAPVIVDMADKQRMEELKIENEALKDKMQRLMEMNLNLANEKVKMVEELTKARALVEDHNSLKARYDNLIQDKTRVEVELENEIKEKDGVELKLHEATSEIERLRTRSLWQRIINK